MAFTLHRPFCRSSLCLKANPLVASGLQPPGPRADGAGPRGMLLPQSSDHTALPTTELASCQPCGHSQLGRWASWGVSICQEEEPNTLLGKLPSLTSVLIGPLCFVRYHTESRNTCCVPGTVQVLEPTGDPKPSPASQR